MNPPKIFISATSGDLGSARQIVKEALLTINCHPVEQTNFEPDWRIATDMLRGKISDCQALIHLDGFRYGAEPDPASLPPGTPRRSYTQMEYHLARELGLRVYTFLLPETYPFDVPKEADTPEKTQLQAAHRALIQSSSRLYERPANGLDLRTRIFALQEQVISLEHEQQSIANEVKTTRHWGVSFVAVILLILGGIGVWQWQTKKATTTIVGGQADLATRMSQMQEALSRLQRNTDPKKDTMGQWSRERLEKELAQQMKLNVEDIRYLLSAGKTSVDALVAGQALLGLGNLDDAEKKFDAVIAKEQSVLLRIRQAYAGKGQIAFDKERYTESLDYRHKAASLIDKATHPEVWADAQEKVTDVLQRLRRGSDAEPLLREIIHIREEFLNSAHIDTGIADSCDKLAKIVSATDRNHEAEDLLRQALLCEENQFFNHEHPAVAIRLQNLAALLKATNRLSEAEPLMRRALKIDEACLSQDAPSIGFDLTNLALLLQEANRQAEAEPLLQRAITIFETAYGKNHPNVAIGVFNLAALFQDLGKLNEAVLLMERMARIFVSTWQKTGQEHPDFRPLVMHYRRLLFSLKRPEVQINAKLRDVLGPELASIFVGPFQVTITEVVKSGQGEALGLQVGDAYVNYNGQPITSMEQFVRLVGEAKDVAIPLDVLRAGKKLTFTAKAGKLGTMIENRPMPPATGAGPAK